jgi:hypothetical protein
MSTVLNCFVPAVGLVQPEPREAQRMISTMNLLLENAMEVKVMIGGKAKGVKMVRREIFSW